MHGWVGGGFTLQQDFPFACRYWFAPTAKKYYIQCKWPQIDHSTVSSFNFFVWSVQCMGGWFDFAAIFPPLLQLLSDLLQLPRNTTLQMTPNCKKITAQHTFARVICKIWDLFALNYFWWVTEETFLRREFSRKLKKVFEFVLVAALVLVLSCWGLGLGRARNVKLSKLIKYHK